jgi:hypothetical protein
VLSVSGPAPEGFDVDRRVAPSFARVSGRQVVALLSLRARTFLLYGRKGGKLVSIPWDKAWGMPTLGATPTDPLSWVQRSAGVTTVMIWDPDRAPRPLAELPITGTFAARRGTLPVWLDTSSSTLFRTLSYPLRGDPTPTREPMPLDGWTDLGAAESVLDRLPICGAQPPPLVGSLNIPQLAFEVDGVDVGPGHAVVDLHVGAAGSCIDGVHWEMGLDRMVRGSVQGFRRVRADLVGPSSLAFPVHSGGPHALICTLVPRP